MAFAYTYSNLIGTFTGGSGDNAGLNIYARPHGTTLRIIGTTALATVTGYNAGTANTGTSATSLAKPAAGTDWTSNALIGKWLKITSGGGASTDGTPVLRPILSNTTTTLAVNTITGMDNTSVFQIVDLASQADRISSGDLIAIRAASCFGKVEIWGMDFSATHSLDGLIELSDCQDVKISACNLAFNTTNPAVNIDRCNKVVFDHCKLTASSDVAIDDCTYVTSTGCVNIAGGTITITNCTSVDITKLSATSSPSRVLGLIGIDHATAEVAASSGGATPVYLESCRRFTAVGGCLTGTGNTGYGVEIAKSGEYTLTGSSITGGTSDVLYDGTHACTWVLHFGSAYGRVANAISNAVAQVAVTKTIVYGNYLWDGSGDHSSRELYYGIFNPAQTTGITAAGTTVADAYALSGGEFYRVDTVAAGTGVKLHNVAALPGVRVMIHNNGANALTVYPNNSGTIDGGASISVATGVVKWLVVTDASYKVWKSIT